MKLFVLKVKKARFVKFISMEYVIWYSIASFVVEDLKIVKRVCRKEKSECTCMGHQRTEVERFIHKH